MGRVRGEASAAVDGDGGADGAEEAKQGLVQDLGLEVPERRVDGRDGRGGDSGAPDVADRADHGEPCSRYVQGVAAFDGLPEGGVDQRGGGLVVVGVADAMVGSGLDLDEHHGGGVPGDGAVGLRGVGGDAVGLA
ncbi:hypothetical protein D3C72_1994020 [compost metagenome]